jgi:general secretion pathway protein D
MHSSLQEILLTLIFLLRCIAGRVQSGRRGLSWLAAICLMTASVAPVVVAQKGPSGYREGRDQEARQNYEAAYDAYLRACETEPADTQCRSAIARTRYLAAASKVHRASLLRQLGRLEQALELFAAAAAIDPSSAIAVQEVTATRSMIQNAKTHPRAGQARAGAELSPDILDAQGPVKLAPVSSLPITLKLSEDTKVVYDTIGKLASLNVLFDPDYTSRRVNIELNGVTLQEALDIVAAESKTFWHPLTPNTIFVATDNPAKRKELEQNVVKTFYLANLTAPTELQDIVNTLRTVLEVSRIQQLPSQEAIVIRGTPDQVLLAEKMVNDFDTAAPEVVVDVAVMQVSRDKVHTLGVTPPTSASVQLKPNTSSSSSSSDNTINLNSLANLKATDFTATISAMSFKALAGDSSTKIIQNPQLRSLNGQKATLKIGDRVPIATGSTQSGLSGTAVAGLTNTQFQYLDVGVNLDVTPHVHSDGEVTLKTVLEVSSVSSYVTIGGISEPVIGQRKVEHEIRLKDGEANLLGGMLEQQDTKSISGIPGLSQIPILKYFFAEKSTEVKDNEIVFVLVPHVVRKREFNELSRKTLDVGNANSIHLRHAPKATPDAEAETSDGRMPIAKPLGEATAALELDPPGISTPTGATFTIDVVLSGAQNVSSVPLQVSYDKKGLQIVNISNGDFLSQGQQVVALVSRDDPSTGTVEITASRPSGSGGVSGHGVISTLTFQAKESGRFPVKITKGAVVQADSQMVSVSGSEITVSVE